MRRIPGGLSAVILLVFMLAFAGCGGGRTIHTASILSDWYSDGDIGYLSGDPTPYIVTQGWDQGVSCLYFGFDWYDSDREYQAFLTFPLDGSTGDAVPLGASIESAILIVNIRELDVPWVRTNLELVKYTPGGLLYTDFYKAPLAARNGVDFYQSDEGFDVAIDVTSLMIEAQALGLPDFQVRFRVTSTITGGLASFEDEKLISFTAPLLVVNYY